MKINKRKFISRMFLLVLIIGVIFGIRYFAVNYEAREAFIDKCNSFVAVFKNKEETPAEKIISFDFENASKSTIVSRGDSILAITSDKIYEYSNSSSPVWTKEISIKNPIASANGDFLVIADENNTGVVLFNMRTKCYGIDIDGQIQNVTVNENGYVGVIYKKVGYKNAFALLDTKGKVVYTKLFANTTLLRADINKDNNRVAVIEADMSEQVTVSALACLNYKGETEVSFIEKNTLLTGVKFTGDNIIAIGDNEIIKINKDNEREVIDKFENEKIINANIETDKIVKIYRGTKDLFAYKSTLLIKNLNNKKVGEGEIEGTIKALYVQGKTIGITLSDRVSFYDMNGKNINTVPISSDFRDMKLFANGQYACIKAVDKITLVKIY